MVITTSAESNTRTSPRFESAVEFCVANGSVGFLIPEPIEWQRAGNQIESATIFARSNFVTSSAVPEFNSTR